MQKYLDIPYVVHRKTLLANAVQTEMADRIGFADGIVSLATGSGKSVIMLIVIARHISAGRKRFLVLAPRILLVEQLYTLLSTYLDYPVYRVLATDDSRKASRNFEKGVLVSTPHTMYSEFAREISIVDFFDALLIDEVHNVSEAYPYTPLKTIKATKVGFSACVTIGSTREICRALGMACNFLENRQVSPRISEVVCEIPCPAAYLQIIERLEEIRRGRLKVYKKLDPGFTPCPEPLTRYMTKRGDVRTMAFRALLAKELRLLHLLKLVGTQNNSIMLSYLRKGPNSRLFYSHECQDVLQAIRGLPPTDDLKYPVLIEVLNKESYKKCLVFVKYRQTARLLFKALKPTFSCALLMGQGKDDDGVQYTRLRQVQILDEFKSNAEILITTTVAEEGLNVPDADLVVCYDPPVNKLRYVQRRGRTGRNGAEGRVIYLSVLGSYDAKYIRRLGLTGKK